MIKYLLCSLILLLNCTMGCGGGGRPEPPPVPVEDPGLTRLKKNVLGKTEEILDIPYEEYVQRFTPSQKTQDLASGTVSDFQGLIKGQDYTTKDYSDIENKYLDQVLSRYSQAREKAYEPIQEALIAENLFGSGPGFGIQSEFAKETGQGAADIAGKFAYEGIQREIGQRQYKDALQRGDYSTMYNLALSEANREVDPKARATQAQLSALTPGLNLTGTLETSGANKYNQQLASYDRALAQYEGEQGDFGDLGSLLGMGAAGAASLLVPGSGIGLAGLSGLQTTALGGLLGGAGGSLIKR